MNLTKEGIEEREDGEMGGGQLFEEGNFFKYFHQRRTIIYLREVIIQRVVGDYLREAIFFKYFHQRRTITYLREVIIQKVVGDYLREAIFLNISIKGGQ